MLSYKEALSLELTSIYAPLTAVGVILYSEHKVHSGFTWRNITVPKSKYSKFTAAMFDAGWTQADPNLVKPFDPLMEICPTADIFQKISQFTDHIIVAGDLIGYSEFGYYKIKVNIRNDYMMKKWAVENNIDPLFFSDSNPT